MKLKMDPEDKLVVRYSELKLVFLSVILLFFIVFPYLLPARINIQENIFFVVAVLAAWLLSAIIYLVAHLKKWRTQYSFLRYVAVITDILFLSAVLFVLPGINSNYFFIFAFVIIGASFYLDPNLIFCAGILSAVIILISFFVEGQNSIGIPTYLLLAVRLAFILAATYFVYLFVLSYKEISRQKEKIKKFSLLNQGLLNHFSNQLRAPLPVIRDFIEVLFLEKAGPLNKRQKEILTMLHDNTRALIEESSNVVYYNQLQTGEFYLKKGQVNMVGLLEKVIERNVDESLSREVEVVYTTRQKEITAGVDQIKLSSAIYALLARMIILANKNSSIHIFSRSSRYSHYIEITFKYIGEPMPNIDKISQDNLDIYIAAKIIRFHGGQIDFLRNKEEEQRIVIILSS